MYCQIEKNYEHNDSDRDIDQNFGCHIRYHKNQSLWDDCEHVMFFPSDF